MLFCDIVDGPVSLTDSLWCCDWMGAERKKGGKERRHRTNVMDAAILWVIRNE